MTIDRWFELIMTELESQNDINIARINERTMSFGKGQKVSILHAVSGRTATLAARLRDGGAISEGAHLVDRVQHLEMRNFAIDELSFRDVASRIALDLQE